MLKYHSIIAAGIAQSTSVYEAKSLAWQAVKPSPQTKNWGMSGLFYSEITMKGDIPFFGIKTVVTSPDLAPDGSVVQSYVQFQNDQNFTDVVCTLTYNAAGTDGWQGTTTCGNQVLSQLTGRASSIRDSLDCGLETGWVLDGDNIHDIIAVNSTKAICTAHRPFFGEGITKEMKYGQTIEYLAGFNIYTTATSLIPDVQGASTSLQQWVVLDSALVVQLACSGLILAATAYLF